MGIRQVILKEKVVKQSEYQHMETYFEPPVNLQVDWTYQTRKPNLPSAYD